MTKDKKCRVRSQEWFRKFACGVADCVGASWAFGIALILILGWGVTGPLFHFSDTWQLVINTATTIVTFLMVFLIQNTQNRDAKAIHLKLDELIRSTSKARNALVNLENLNDDELANLQAHGGLREVELARGGREAAEFDDLGQRPELIEVEAAHLKEFLID